MQSFQLTLHTIKENVTIFTSTSHYRIYFFTGKVHPSRQLFGLSPPTATYTGDFPDNPLGTEFGRRVPVTTSVSRSRTGGENGEGMEKPRSYQSFLTRLRHRGKLPLYYTREFFLSYRLQICIYYFSYHCCLQTFGWRVKLIKITIT